VFSSIFYFETTLIKEMVCTFHTTSAKNIKYITIISPLKKSISGSDSVMNNEPARKLNLGTDSENQINLHQATTGWVPKISFQVAYKVSIPELEGFQVTKSFWVNEISGI
jgi:hypothetical protein